MIETPISKTATVAEMIIAELASTDHALASSDLYERLEIDSGDTVIHRAIGTLLKDGRIELDEPRLGKRGQPAKTYRLPRSDATRLMEHLEAELGQAESPAAHFAARVLAKEDPADPEACLNSASASHNGDELHVIHAHIPGETATTFAHLADRHTDPVIRAIDRLSEPAWLEGRMHVARLRALASCELIENHIDIAAWLNDLAAAIEEMSA